MLAATLGALACTSEASSEGAGDDGGAGGYEWALPAGFPVPLVPDDNPMSTAKVELGRALFYDRRLSDNGTQSCATCHLQALAFTDGHATTTGSTGQPHSRGALGLANVAYASVLTWANPLLFDLEDQALVPLFSNEPVELGLSGKEGAMLDRLRAEPRYLSLFAAAFPELEGERERFSVATVVRAIASFERTILSGGSPYDRFVTTGDPAAMSPSAQRGLALFASDELACASCHAGFNLQDSVKYVGKDPIEAYFHNTGLYNLGGTGAYPAESTGLMAITARPGDMGRFRAPTLRNVAVTAPYMHDGSIATLGLVLDHYAAGGRTVASGPHAGVGSESPLKSQLIHGFVLTPGARADILSFLESLTDNDFLHAPGLGDPWAAP